MELAKRSSIGLIEIPGENGTRKPEFLRSSATIARLSRNLCKKVNGAIPPVPEAILVEPTERGLIGKVEEIRVPDFMQRSSRDLHVQTLAVAPRFFKTPFQRCPHDGQKAME